MTSCDKLGLCLQDCHPLGSLLFVLADSPAFVLWLSHITIAFLQLSIFRSSKLTSWLTVAWLTMTLHRLRCYLSYQSPVSVFEESGVKSQIRFDKQKAKSLQSSKWIIMLGFNWVCVNKMICLIHQFIFFMSCSLLSVRTFQLLAELCNDWVQWPQQPTVTFYLQ